jgi:hypothetical protein
MMRRFLGGRCIMVLIGAGLGLARACGAQAATIAVTTCNAADLIAAIDAANTSSGADTIELNAGCTYTLTAVNNTSGTTTNGLPVVTDSLTINGHGDTIVRSSVAAFRILDFAPTAAASFVLNDLTISGGQSCCGTAGGGAIRNGSLSTLSLTNVTLSGNLADHGNGGAIYNDGGEVTITNSTVAQNDSGGGDGGGIYNDGGTLTVTGTTISSNLTADATIAGNGGGLFTNGGTSTLTNCTVTANSATAGGGIYNEGTTNLNNVTVVGNFTGPTLDTGGGIYNVPGHTVNVRNSIIALNSDPVGPDCWSDAGGIVSGGYNLIGDADACNWSTATGDWVGSGTTPINPLVGSLRNNGGPTMTQALLPGSPAIDAGNPSGCRGPDGNVLSTDQRGFPRPVAGDADNDVICDIGAYELQLAPTAPALSPRALLMLAAGLALLGVLALANRPWRHGTAC